MGKFKDLWRVCCVKHIISFRVTWNLGEISCFCQVFINGAMCFSVSQQITRELRFFSLRSLIKFPWLKMSLLNCPRNANDTFQSSNRDQKYFQDLLIKSNIHFLSLQVRNSSLDGVFPELKKNNVYNMLLDIRPQLLPSFFRESRSAKLLYQ